MQPNLIPVSSRFINQDVQLPCFPGGIAHFPGEERSKKDKAAGIRWSSPTQLLIRRSVACVWQSGRMPNIPQSVAVCGRKYCIVNTYSEKRTAAAPIDSAYVIDTDHPPLRTRSDFPTLDKLTKMASKVLPFVRRTAVGSPRLALRPKCRTFTSSTRAASEALFVVSMLISGLTRLNAKQWEMGPDRTYSTETLPKTTPKYPSNSPPQMKSSSKRYSSDIRRNTRRLQ